MNAYPKHEQSNEQVVAQDARLPYEPPALVAMGKVEHLTALAGAHSPDFFHLFKGNIL